MRNPPRLAALLLATAALGWSSLAAAQAGVDAAEQACTPGADQKVDAGGKQAGQYRGESGPTPTGLKGAVTVSPREAKCLMDKLGDRLVVVQAMNDTRELPRAVAVPDAGSWSEDGKTHRDALQKLADLTRGDKDRPLLLYCHSSACHFSYNATLRAVRAGYAKVYWLREGNSGWVNAGYPLKVDVLDAQGFPGDYAATVQACEREGMKYGPREYGTDVLTNPGAPELESVFQRSLALAQEKRTGCLRAVAAARRGNEAVAKDVAARLARSDQEVAQHYQATRAVIEKDPAGAFGRFLEQVDVAALQGLLARVRAPQTVLQVCGTPISAMPDSPAEVQAVKRRLVEYRTCHDGLKAANKQALPADTFRKLVDAAAAVERFTCTRNPMPKCLPDAVWRPVAEVATPANAKILQDARLRRDALDGELARANAEVNEWVDRVNAHVAKRKQEIGGNDRRDSPASGGGSR